ncbi:MAG: S-layer homology domain-containing protein [Clostridia bacterium]|nr:S-layer homology domain-containing protein [Clostridia bacterium]
MKRNGMKNKFIALCSAIMMLFQICSVQVFASTVVPEASSVNETDSVLNIDLSKIDGNTTLVAFYTNNAEAVMPTVPDDVVIFEQEDPLQSSYSFTPIAEPKDYMIVIFESRSGQQIKDVITLTHVTHYYDGWSGDETEHWKECINASCNNRIDVAEHSDITQNPSDCTASPVCGVCGLDAGVANESHLYTDSFDTDCNRDGCMGVRTASAVEITLDTNGGNSLTQSTVTTGANGKLTADLPQPTRNGWRFNGWYTATTGGTKVDKATTVFYDDATIYAQWTSVYQQGGSGSSGGGGATVAPVTYKLHFETNGGTGVNDLSRQKGIEINVTGFVPVKEGYKFIGWYTDAKLENAVSSIKLTSDMTVYAKWEVIEDEPVTEPEPSEKTFTDVSENDWFESSVAFVLENGIMNGVSETEFAPHNTTTRAMLVTMLYRLDGEPETSAQNDFSDVSKDAYYEKAVVWAKENGIVNGYENGSFGTDDAVTREQLASILYRYAEHKGYNADYEDTNILSFNDAFDISEYAYPALQWACKNGIINGDGNNLMPKASAERCQVAAIFARFCELNK